MKKTWTNKSHLILKHATGLGRYNIWIISLFKKYFAGEILEIGSGIGGLSIHLPKKHTTLSEIRKPYFSYLKSNFSQKVLMLNIENDTSLQYKNSFDSIFSSNVFEHIKDDQQAMKNCYTLLKKNGTLMLFVPSCPEIYGSLDKAMGHFRRYSKSKLQSKVEIAGFNIVELKYVNFIGFFTWWLRGRLPVKSNADSLLSKIFDIAITPFLYLEKYIPAPFGQSLMLIARKS